MSRFLYWLVNGLAMMLVATVGLAPWFDTGAPEPVGWERALAFFARDAVLRQIVLVSAAGLAVTAQIFFSRPRTDVDPAPAAAASSVNDD